MGGVDCTREEEVGNVEEEETTCTISSCQTGDAAATQQGQRRFRFYFNFCVIYFISGAMTMPDSRGRQAKSAFDMTGHCHVLNLARPFRSLSIHLSLHSKNSLAFSFNHLISASLFPEVKELQCVAVCCSVLQRVAVCCSAFFVLRSII